MGPPERPDGGMVLMNCDYCHQKLFDTDRFCACCGAPIILAIPQLTAKKEWQEEVQEETEDEEPEIVSDELKLAYTFQKAEPVGEFWYKSIKREMMDGSFKEYITQIIPFKKDLWK
jgi:uncharacterized Zn finger protein (UPF0148 family)